MTLWAGVFDLRKRQVTYVNAGHGYAFLALPDGAFTMLDAGEDFPIGFVDQAEYRAITQPLPPAGRALVLSDGIVEQFGAAGDAAQEQFGLKRVKAALSATTQDDVITALFDAVVRHAQSSGLQDDATAVLVGW
jgi:sigma-B regulation protein RsbU (phosphoserine phosphatase)